MKLETNTYANDVKGSHFGLKANKASKEIKSTMNDNWVIDSGCTDHMACSKTGISNFKETITDVLTANNEIIRTTGVGDLQCKTGNSKVLLKNVLTLAATRIYPFACKVCES